SAGVETLMRAVGQLWTLGHKIDWHRFHAPEDRRKVQLPTYPFERQRFWIDPDKGKPSGEQVSGTRESPPSDMLFREVWERAELPAAINSNTSGSWLVFRDRYGLGDGLIAYLRSRGEHCTEVSLGTAYGRPGNDSYALDPENPEHYASLFDDLKRDARVPHSIVHLWSLCRSTDLRNHRAVEQAKTLSFYSLLFLGRAFGAADISSSMQLAVVSNWLLNTDGQRVLRPERALLFGPSGTIPKEFPNVRCRNI